MKKWFVLPKKSSQKVKFSPDTEEIRISRDLKNPMEGITVSVGENTLIISSDSPANKKVAEFAELGKNILGFFYESEWKEYRLMCYGGSVVVIQNGVPKLLPGVKPEAVIYTNAYVPHLIISQVEESPFGCPCAAILPLDKITESNDIRSLYVFPEKPIIIEGFAATAAGGRIHESRNVAGTGLNDGDVPHIYDWVSPDNKEHGWAFALYCKWEIDGGERPTENWEKDRCIDYDPIWDDDGDEPYNVYIGERIAKFPSLHVNGNREITRFQIRDVVMASRVKND
jgi:hypothetical protein